MGSNARRSNVLQMFMDQLPELVLVLLKQGLTRVLAVKCLIFKSCWLKNLACSEARTIFNDGGMWCQFPKAEKIQTNQIDDLSRQIVLM